MISGLNLIHHGDDLVGIQFWVSEDHFSIANHQIRTFELVLAYVALDLRIALQFHTNDCSSIEMSA